jgi:hypothetical protein
MHVEFEAKQVAVESDSKHVNRPFSRYNTVCSRPVSRRDKQTHGCAVK